jgi:hypothetical protein
VDGVCDDPAAGDAGGSELGVQVSDLVAQVPVFVVEFTDARVGEGEPLPQRRVRAPLSLLDDRWACWALVSDLADLVA